MRFETGIETNDSESDWPQQLPEAFYQALEEFNRREYFECHETLEALWIPERRSVRELYQGVLQIAVGCHHLIRRANRVGAISLLERGARHLERTGIASMPDGSTQVEPTSVIIGRYGVDWDALIQAADRLQAHLRRPEHNTMTGYDSALLPVIIFKTRGS